MNTLKSKSTPFTRIGILGGTFDPIHFGHIKPAISNAEALSLDYCFLLPANIPPHKSSTNANSNHRKIMTQLICDEFPLFQLDDRELKKETPSYTVESVREISQENPLTQVFFIIGMDSLLTLTTWHQWKDILNYCHLFVNVRPGFCLSELTPKCSEALSPFFIDNLEDVNLIQSGKIIFHHQVEVAISSTEIRNEIAHNIFDSSKVPDKVLTFIKENSLYQKNCIQL